MADRLGPYRAKRDFDATPEPAARRRTAASGGAALRRAGAPRARAALGPAARARGHARLVGGARRASRPTRSATTSPCARRTTRSSTSSSRATIPEGNYGAGTMRIWDRGTYELHKFREDEVMVTFHGERLQGRYVLFRTGGKNWMIHRMDPPQDADREPMPERLEPMLAAHGRRCRADDGRWAYEIKWDGVRALGYVEGGRLRLASRNGNDITPRYPELRELGRALGLARGGARRRGGRVRRRTASRASSACRGACTCLRERGAAAGAQRAGRPT